MGYFYRYTRTRKCQRFLYDIIKSRSTTNIIVAVYPNYIEEDEFTRYMLIKTEAKYQEGVVIIEETVYKITGTIER